MKTHLATIVTTSRVAIAMLFYVLVVHVQINTVWALLLCFGLIELSDILDGAIARGTSTVSDLGKLLDPLCDVTAHFLCIYALQQIRLAPSIIVVIFILREIWVQMLRTQLIKRNVVLAAKFSGKIKTWLFGVAVFGSLLLYPNSLLSNYALELRSIVFGIYYLAGLVSILSGLQYLAGAIKVFKSEKH